mgnify:CR=1 FL=1
MPKKDHLLNYILKHYGVNSGFMRKKVMNPPFPGHAPPQRHLKMSELGDRKGANGGKREGERSERESVVTRQDKDSRRVGGHAPPQRHLKMSERDDENEVYGEKTE